MNKREREVIASARHLCSLVRAEKVLGPTPYGIKDEAIEQLQSALADLDRDVYSPSTVDELLQQLKGNRAEV